MTAIHRIQGICGDAQLDVPFTYMDGSPPELSTIQYRIRLGYDGVSSTQTVVFNQLISTEHRFYPSPMFEQATLLLNVAASAQVELNIFDAAGRIVEHRTGAIGREHRIELPGVQSGIYSYPAISHGKRFSGSFGKE